MFAKQENNRPNNQYPTKRLAIRYIHQITGVQGVTLFQGFSKVHVILHYNFNLSGMTCPGATDTRSTIHYKRLVKLFIYQTKGGSGGNSISRLFESARNASRYRQPIRHNLYRNNRHTSHKRPVWSGSDRNGVHLPHTVYTISVD